MAIKDRKIKILINTKAALSPLNNTKKYEATKSIKTKSFISFFFKKKYEMQKIGNNLIIKLPSLSSSKNKPPSRSVLSD